MPINGIVLRIPKGSELTPGEMDNNIAILRDFGNSLEQLVLISFDEDGKPKSELVNALTGAGYADGALSSGAYVVTLDPEPAAYESGMRVWMRALTANTGAVDININGLGQKNILKNVTSELEGGELPQNGIVELVYDGTNFQLVSVYAGISASQMQESARGGLHQYSIGTFSAGVYSLTLSPAPTQYLAGMRVVFRPSAANTGATELNINGLGAKKLYKNVTQDLTAGDISANGMVEAIYDGSNFQLITTQATASVFVSDEYDVVSGKVADVAHNLNGKPTKLRWVFVCKTTDGAFAVSDEIDVLALYNDQSTRQSATVGANETNVFLVLNTANNLNTRRKDNGNDFTLTASKWKAKCYAQL